MCKALLQQLRVCLETVTVEAPDYDTLQFLRALRRLYTGVEGEPLTASERFALIHSFSKHYESVREKPEVAALYSAVKEYRDLLTDRR